MSDLSNFTHVFRSQDGDQRKVSKRNRAPVSCVACRARKLKCDRQHPCGACTRRGESATCDFRAPHGNPSDGNGRKEARSKAEAQARLQRLEEMVSGLLKQGAGGSPGGDASSVKSTAKEQNGKAIEDAEGRLTAMDGEVAAAGRLGAREAESFYVGATHWQSILDSIRDVKDYFDSDVESVRDEKPAQLIPPSNLNLFIDPTDSITLPEILAALPPRHIVDRLLSMYFTDKFNRVVWLHSSKFQRDCDAFWMNPASTSYMWMSILFSTLCVSLALAKTRDLALPDGTREFTVDNFGAVAGRCLITGQHLTPQPFVIEALLLYGHTKMLQNNDSDSSNWLMLALVTRQAQRMGYHRDPRHLGTSSPITPFQTEIRRRLWLHISTLDVLFSMRLGIPCIIHEEECDAELPSNLVDDDFDEEIEELPAPRPFSDLTPMLYHCYKGRILGLFRRILRTVLAAKQPEFEHVMKLHAELQVVRDGIPPSLTFRRVKTTSFMDEPYMILQRFFVEIIWLKSLCVLHRTYLVFEKENPKFAFARDTCKASALRILELQTEFHEESHPGGRLQEQRWTLLNLAFQDFLLASMIVGLDVSEHMSKYVSLPLMLFPILCVINRILLQSTPDRNRKLAALTSCYHIWCEGKQGSRDAAHATKVLASLIAKATGEAPVSKFNAPTTTPQSASESVDSGVDLQQPKQVGDGELSAMEVGATMKTGDFEAAFLGQESLEGVLGDGTWDWVSLVVRGLQIVMLMLTGID